LAATAGKRFPDAWEGTGELGKTWSPRASAPATAGADAPAYSQFSDRLLVPAATISPGKHRLFLDFSLSFPSFKDALQVLHIANVT